MQRIPICIIRSSKRERTFKHNRRVMEISFRINQVLTGWLILLDMGQYCVCARIVKFPQNPDHKVSKKFQDQRFQVRVDALLERMVY